jgi:hypothetical protein
MPEIISCPSCRRRLQAPESVLGQDVQCPTCGTTFTARFGPPESVQPPPVTEDRPEPAPRPRRDDYGLDDDPGRGERDGWRERRGGTAPHRGPVILTLGILALVGLVIVLPGLILGPIAWAMGNGDMALIRAGRMDPEGQGVTSAGQTCGMVATILGLLAVVGLCLLGVREGGFLNRGGW